MKRQLYQDKKPAQIRAILGENPADHLVDKIETVFDVDVVVVPLAGDGYVMSWPSRDVIVTACSPSWFRQIFTIAHEVGHLANETYCDGILSAHENDEAAANHFAADLLMPEEQIRSIDWQNLDLGVLADFIWKWGVSTEALSSRLSSLKIVPAPPIAQILAGKTQALLRKHWSMPPGPDLITQRMENSSTRRFPTALISALETAVREGRAPKASLAYALGVEENRLDVNDHSADDLESGLLLLDDMG